MPGKTPTTILHLAFDHQSTRFLSEIVGELDGVRNLWWIAPQEQIGDLRGFRGERLATDDDVLQSLTTGVDAVVIHRLKPVMFEWLSRIPADVPVVWATWGDDYYRMIPALSRQLFLPWTKLSNALLLKFSIYLSAFQRKWSRSHAFDQAVERIDAVSTLLQENAPFLPFLKAPNLTILPSWYNQVPDGLETAWATTRPAQVLLGTSAGNTGNQMDLLVSLRRSRLPKGLQLTGNLGYGSIRYKYWVQVFGTLMFGTRWTGQLSRISIDDYLTWLRSFSVLMMYNLRTQGTGTLVLALWFGIRVCLRPDCHFAQFLSRNGFAITLLGSSRIDAVAFAPLSDAERELNRRLVREIFGPQGVQTAYIQFVDLVRTGALSRRASGT